METGKMRQIILSATMLLALCGTAIQADWTTPVPLTEVNTEYTESSPFLSYDALSLYFTRRETDTFYHARIYEARRDVPEGPFTSVTELSELNSGSQNVIWPWVSADNLRMYYSKSVTRLIFSERASVSDPWPQGSDITELNALGSVYDPTLTTDELTIVFHSPDIAGGYGGYDLWMAARSNTGSPFGNVRNLDELNTSYNELNGFICSDGLTLYFSSDRNGIYQIFMATRPSVSEPFGSAVHIAAFDSPSGSRDPSISSDGTAFYFRTMESAPDKPDIYVSYSVEPNLVAHWKFDEGAGTVAYDSVGNNDGTLANGPVWSDGKIGGALDFGGNEGVYVNSSEGTGSELNIYNRDLTISAWVKYEGQAGTIVARAKHLAIAYRMGLSSNYPGYPYVNSYLNGPGHQTVFSDTPLPVGQWRHVVGVFDRTNDIGRVYINGVETGSGPIPVDPVSNDAITRIGCRNDVSDNAFTGSIDDVRIYGRVLTDNEIWQLYNMQQQVAVDIKPGACPNPLNLSSRGVLPVAILGSQELDVNTIDVASIRLEGIAPMRSGYEDVAAPVAGGEECGCTTEGPDGWTDLMLKFQTQAIVAKLLDEYPDLAKNDVVVLTLTGVLTDQTPIEGEDCIVIKGKYHSR